MHEIGWFTSADFNCGLGSTRDSATFPRNMVVIIYYNYLMENDYNYLMRLVG